jgi:hypothetical protein
MLITDILFSIGGPPFIVKVFKDAQRKVFYYSLVNFSLEQIVFPTKNKKSAPKRHGK